MKDDNIVPCKSSTNSKSCLINKSFHFIQSNVNGLLSKVDEVQVFISAYDPDIFLISETHLTEDNISLNHIAGYKSFNYCRQNKSWGGSSIFIKEEIFSSVIR